VVALWSSLSLEEKLEEAFSSSWVSEMIGGDSFSWKEVISLDCPEALKPVAADPGKSVKTNNKITSLQSKY
jgi:hypothetical protein